MEEQELKRILEAALMAAGRPLNLDEMSALFHDAGRPDKGKLRAALQGLANDLEGRGVELVEVASGYRVQARKDYSEWVSRLWEEKPPRYSRALLETLALVAYRQPITRGDIEEVRGVSVSSNIIRTLQERGWIRVVGHRDVPGRPEMFGTTREFLDYFGLKTLEELPTLAELRDIDSMNVELDFEGESKEGEAPEAAEDSDEEPGEARGAAEPRRRMTAEEIAELEESVDAIQDMEDGVTRH